MEKDLRDAYAALKLLRADLVKTRRDKRALEASLTHLQTHPSAAQTRETRQMEHEDANSQLWRMTVQYESRLAEMERKLKDNNCQKKENTPEIEETSNQLEEEEEEEEEDDGLEKLTLLNKLHSLTATVEQQTQTMLAQQAAFALLKGELETTLEETQHKLHAEKGKVADAVLEQQATKENYEFLETQVDILKEEKRELEEEKMQLEGKLAAHAQTSCILKQQLEEKEEERSKWESETERRELDHELKMDTLVKELSAKFRQKTEVKEKELHDEHQREILQLQQKNGLLELELSSEKEKKLHDAEETKERYTTTLGDLERNCAELKALLADSEAKRTAEAKEHREELEEANGQYATTLFNLQSKLAAVQSQLETSEAKLAEEAKNHGEQLMKALEKLHDHQHDQERHAITLHDLESNLAETQLQLADSETKHLADRKEYEEKLAETSHVTAQHEKTTRALAMEKKALQQEVREARQTSKLTTEEFLKCQSVMEQKTQEHLQYINQVQEQCESLETQLLSAEDHKDSSGAVKPVKDLYTLNAFHGLSDNEIAAMSPSKSWALLRSEINEMDGFLPHLQAVLGAMSNALTLCETHADILPALCERRQGKTASEKGELPILSTALCLLRIAVVLKARIKEEETPVTPKIVQSFCRRVLDVLAQWYECGAGDNDQGENRLMPTPTFTITSRETALILQNWTNDRTKQLGVRRWLARMEAYPGVPPLRGASSNRVLELPPEGCTLELEDMTPEVKDAFLLLLIPILKQNRALHVRVFTRYSGNHGSTLKQQRDDEADSHDDAEKVWAMRIHVQSTVTGRNESFRPPPLKLLPSPRGPPSPLAPTSPASSVSSSTSSTASSRLQIIQERLQYLHNNV